MPSLPPGGKEYIDLLFDVGPAVPIGMGGWAPITEADIGWYRLNRAERLSAEECRLLREASRAYADTLNTATDPKMPAPYKPAEEMNEQARDAIAKSVSSWLDKLA